MLEELGVLYRGLILGFIIAAPVGPVGLLCVRRTLQKGVATGLATGFGAACADALFGAVAVLGVSAILGFIHSYEAIIRIVGGLIVLGAAWHTWFDHPKPPPQPLMDRVIEFTHDHPIKGKKHRILSLLRAMSSSLIITLTNPLTLFGTLALVASFGAITSKLEAGVLISGIFAGSALWWLMLSSGVGLFRHLFTEKRIVKVNRVTAVGLAALGLWAFLSGIKNSLF